MIDRNVFAYDAVSCKCCFEDVRLKPIVKACLDRRRNKLGSLENIHVPGNDALQEIKFVSNSRILDKIKRESVDLLIPKVTDGLEESLIVIPVC